MSSLLHKDSLDKSSTLPAAILTSDPNALETEKQPSKPLDTPPTPPDGGLTAWLQVVGAFFLFFNSW